MFGAGWWLFVDAHVRQAHYHYSPEVVGYYYVPGIVGTFALILTNIVDLEALNPVSWIYDPTISSRVRAWLFMCFILSFSSVAASIWIDLDKFKSESGRDSYPGTALILQNVMFMFSSFTLLYAKTVSKDPEYESI